MNWSWEWIFYRKKEMQGCGAASGRGSSQVTCHGAIYRPESQQGCSELRNERDLLVVGPGTWQQSMLT